MTTIVFLNEREGGGVYSKTFSRPYNIAKDNINFSYTLAGQLNNARPIIQLLTYTFTMKSAVYARGVDFDLLNKFTYFVRSIPLKNTKASCLENSCIICN